MTSSRRFISLFGFLCLFLSSWVSVAVTQESKSDSLQSSPRPRADRDESIVFFGLELGNAKADSLPITRVRVEGTPVAVMRAGPGSQHPIALTVFEDEILIIDARSGAWLHVSTLEGVSGWIHNTLVSEGIDKDRFDFDPDPRKMERQRRMYIQAFVGSYAADREDNGFLFGARMGYAMTPRLSVEIAAASTKITRSTFVIEEIFNLRLEEENFNVFFYEAGASVDVLPGRRITPFVTLGVGATILNARVEPTWSLGIGTRAFLTRTIALRWEIRDHRYEVGNQFTRFQGDNLEFSAGTEILF